MGGYTAGNGQMYDEVFADDLVKKGVAEYADVPKPKVEKKMPVVDEPKEKALDKPVKDKMIRSPKKKK